MSTKTLDEHLTTIERAQLDALRHAAQDPGLPGRRRLRAGVLQPFAAACLA